PQAGDIVAVIGHDADGLPYDTANLVEQAAAVVFGQSRGERIATARKNTLSQQNRNPAVGCEEVVLRPEHSAAVAEQRHLVGQGLRDGHGAAMVPERAVVAPG